MEYLLILFLVAVALSPLMWIKSSPGQLRATKSRARARALGLQVQLVPEVDAEAAATRPEAVRYFRGFPPDEAAALHRELGSWTLVKNHRRGWQSPWPEWKWLRGEAAEPRLARIGEALQTLPASAYGLRAESGGVAVFLRETGGEEDVDRVAESLGTLLQP